MTAPTQVSRGPNPDTQEKHVPVTVPILRWSVENGLPVTPGFHPSYTSKMSAVHTASLEEESAPALNRAWE